MILRGLLSVLKVILLLRLIVFDYPLLCVSLQNTWSYYFLVQHVVVLAPLKCASLFRKFYFGDASIVSF